MTKDREATFLEVVLDITSKVKSLSDRVITKIIEENKTYSESMTLYHKDGSEFELVVLTRK